jgi:hypothetical protein
MKDRKSSTVTFGADGVEFPASSLDPSLESYQATHAVDAALRTEFAAVPEVCQVAIERILDSCLVWIALDNPEREVREKVFDQELRLIEAFPEVNFDFQLVPAVNREPHKTSNIGTLLYSRSPHS